MVLPIKDQECPVCTLYLRAGISLRQHLETHPKEQVIEALLRQIREPEVPQEPPAAITTAKSTAPCTPTPQLTTAVTYQQILTTNSAGTVVPQFLQVPALVNSPYALSQNVGFTPTMFNPLYNPYVPQQYHPFSDQNNDAQLKCASPTPESKIEDEEQEVSEEGSVEMEMSLGSPLETSRPSSPEPPPPTVIIARSTRTKAVSLRSATIKPLSRRRRSPIAIDTSTSSSAMSKESELSVEPPTICKTEDSVIVEVVSLPSVSADLAPQNRERSSSSCKLESDEEEPETVVVDLSDRTDFTKNPCPNLPFDHEVVADLPILPKLTYGPAEPSTSRVSDSSDQLLNQLTPEEVSNCEMDSFTGKSDDDEICFDYVDEAANFSAPGNSNPGYSDLLPSSSPRMLHDLMPATSPKMLNDLLPTASSSNAFMDLDGLRIFFNNNAPVATASRVSSPPSVIQMADSTKKEHLMPLNIAADESMPARGELSEQESLGADSAWGMFQSEMKIDQVWSVPQDNKPLRCPSCTMMFTCPKERRTHRLQAHSKPGKAFKCTVCSQVFNNLRDRRAHMAVHSDVKPVKEELAGGSAGQGAPEVTSTIRHCPACAATLPSVRDLRVHMRQVHNEVRFKCHECEECFDEETDYNVHLKKHPLKCPECGKCFFRRANLNLHLKRHLPNKPFECHLCPKSFITRQKLEEHSNTHSGVKPLKCGQCDKTFNRHSNLIQHRHSHHAQGKKKLEARDFVCRCGEVFHSQRKLEWHRETHENKPKSCPFCSQKFIHSASVTRHVRRSHMPGYLPNETRTEDENVSCPICDKVYLRSSLAVHMRVHNGIRNFQCTVCSKSFTTKWNMELHMWTHQSRSAMPYKCNLCKSAFFREADHIAHLNAHKNLKPFICNVCGQKFIRKYNCLRHQEEHQRAKRFVCTVAGCNRTFHRSYYLKDHMKVHTGARPHTCHMCGKASSTKSNHNKHVRIHDIREMVNTEN